MPEMLQERSVPGVVLVTRGGRLARTVRENGGISGEVAVFPASGTPGG